MKDNPSLQNNENSSDELGDEGGLRRNLNGNCTRKGFLGSTIRDFRKKIELSQSEVAEKISIPPSQYNHYETGNLIPDVYMLIEICEVLNVDPVGLISIAISRAYSIPEKKLSLNVFESKAKAIHIPLELRSL